ncbi:CoA ester lyase [Variovorax sp. NFACC27]|uniref:HpcH/HpaI aldolase/citrate lyase family protein n=1 Tax=unclassified Variovorax TaxID=663243 RepID=UPI000896F017|nr:citrate lyase subunit beta / citryl-CoA lyase [Variovorax sp. NFACC28]SEG84188.1 citrate lyase subunit beta / citryl-CoA lyase [Variovorax sp. NFACC29]SFD16626.1 citrate lyase subunit beta / citryl-CoA lyase [Variovorax sp. NFACC26]SFG24307.1 citrate lyase subunit beta / citryl-CoA lyase [Variovorax sp. NFACC27]
MRSKLFVPGTRPELFAKALAGEADAISLDLEDAVSEPRKDEARETVRRFLESGEAASSRKTLIVRVNAMDTPHFERDVAAVARTGVHLINLPKPQSPAHVRAAAEAIERAERANGVQAPIGLLLNIETPNALRTAAELALAHPRVAGLQLGLGDLFEPLGIARREPSAIRQAMFAVRIAAGEAGLYAYDSAFANIRDAEGFRAEAMLARDLGFLGKTCIHPSQIAIANEVFRPTDEEIAHACKVVEAARDADARGVGAYVVDGKMIDIPFVIRARAIVESARSLGLIPG